MLNDSNSLMRFYYHILNAKLQNGLTSGARSPTGLLLSKLALFIQFQSPNTG